MAPAVWGQDPRSLLNEAVQFHQEGRLEEAAARYRAVLELQPNIPEIRSNLGAVYSALGRYGAAINEYEEALRLNPTMAPARLNLGLAYYKSARIADAVVEFRRMLEDDPSNHQALSLLSNGLLAMGRYTEAIALLEPRTAEVEGSKLLTFVLGTAYLRENRSVQGQRLIDRLFRDGDTPEGLMLLAASQMSAHDYAGARDNLAKAVELDPELATIHTAYAMALMSTGDQAGARAEFEEELRRNPHDFEANLNMAAIYKQERDLDRAESSLRRSLEIRPQSLAAQYQLATIQLSKQQFEEARTLLEHIVAESPSFTEAHVSLATAYYRLKMKAEGDREREIVRQLNTAKQATQPGSQAALAAEEEDEQPEPEAVR